jgi:Somatomedin B domain
METMHRGFVGLCGGALVVVLGTGPVLGAETLAVERATLAGQSEARVALQESIERRERELRSEKRGRIVTQVRQRARELGVAADPEVLTDRLFERARLVLERDRCLLAELPTAACASVEPALVRLEEDFHRLTGWTAADFKSGRRDKALPPSGVPGAAMRSYSPDHCRCSALVYSRDRFLNRYWGLECNGHAGHGVCSTNLDSFHTAGTGAMTGAIDVFFGSSPRGRDCPDDHRTCFKGPKPSKTNGGEWGNVCNCDTWHSQSSNPFGAWYSGDLTDAAEVWQGSFYDMVSDGSCEGQWISVSEFIEENDPICCDDAMGTLWASAPVGNGHRESFVPTSAQNCNGGSQSGVPPYCGTFGATIRIATDCQTYPDDWDASCYNRCGQEPAEATCSCTVDCQWQGNCCSDYYSFCYY